MNNIKLIPVMLLSLLLGGCGDPVGTASSPGLPEGINKLSGQYEIIITSSGEKIAIKVQDEKFSGIQEPAAESGWEYSINNASSDDKDFLSLRGFGFAKNKEGKFYVIYLKSKPGKKSKDLPPDIDSESSQVLSKEGDVFILGGDLEQKEFSRLRRLSD